MNEQQLIELEICLKQEVKLMKVYARAFERKDWEKALDLNEVLYRVQITKYVCFPNEREETLRSMVRLKERYLGLRNRLKLNTPEEIA